MPVLTACRCGKPMLDNTVGALYCEHCDRICEKNAETCTECRNVKVVSN